jgi:hypothetical protein
MRLCSLIGLDLIKLGTVFLKQLFRLLPDDLIDVFLLVHANLVGVEHCVVLLGLDR